MPRFQLTGGYKCVLKDIMDKEEIKEKKKRRPRGRSRPTLPEKPKKIMDIKEENDIEIMPKHEGYLMLRQNGMTTAEATKALGYSRQHGYIIDKKYDKYLISNNPKLLKLAHTNLKNMLQLDSQTKDSSRVALINMVYDRHDPVKRQEPGSTNISFTTINLDSANSSITFTDRNSIVGRTPEKDVVDK